MSRAQFISDLSDKHQELVLSSLKSLEERIVNEIQFSQTLFADELNLRTKTALQLRPNLKKYFEETFLTVADTNVREYDTVVKALMGRIEKINVPNRFKTLTKPDLATIVDLKKFSFNKYKELGSTYFDTVANDLYESVIVGKPFPDMVKSIRGKLNGVYQSSNEEAINRLVRYIDENQFNPAVAKKVAQAQNILRTKYASDVLGNNMRRYAKTIAHDTLMEFNGSFTTYKAEQAGINMFIYDGTLITDSRDFCRRNLNRVFDRKDIDAFWGSQSWKGKSGNNPFIHRGGYNCRHILDLWDFGFDEGVVDVAEENLEDKFGTDKGDDMNFINLAFGHLATNQITKIINKTPKLRGGVDIDRTESYYAPYNNTIYMASSLYKDRKDLKKGFTSQGLKTFRHEYGHHIDKTMYTYLNNKEVLPILIKKYGLEPNKPYLSPFISKAIVKDAKLWASKTWRKPFREGITARLSLDEYLEATPDFPLTKAEIQKISFTGASSQIDHLERIYLRRTERIELGGDYKDFGSIADTVGSITKGKYGWGHSIGYYSGTGKYRWATTQYTEGRTKVKLTQTLEPFAQYVESKSSPLGDVYVKLLRWYAPNTTQALDDLFEDIERYL